MANLVFELGLGLTVAGLLVAFAAIIMIMTGKKGDRQVRGGGILFIGPIPVIFGTDNQSVKILVLLVIASIGMIAILMVLPYWLR
ncbi:MAG TPA: DUF131 domain-containing protein [Methylomirabilota bacterium]|nr:DUF131 domain-containing protein [Methylomirabilota bacterium]